MKLFGLHYPDENHHYLLVSGAPLLHALVASAIIPVSMALLVLGPAWLGNFIVTLGFLWFFSSGQIFYTQAEKVEPLHAERVFFFWIPAWLLLFVLGAWSLIPAAFYVVLALVVIGIGTYLAHRYLPWVSPQKVEGSEKRARSKEKIS